MSRLYDRVLRPRRIDIENLILVGILVIGSAIAWAVYDTTKTAFEDRLERKENQTCRNIANQKVPCPEQEKTDDG